MKANDRVRLCDDPGRRGTVTGRTRPRRGVTSWQVRFDDGSSSYISEDAIEAIPDTSEDPLDLLAGGRTDIVSQRKLIELLNKIGEVDKAEGYLLQWLQRAETSSMRLHPQVADWYRLELSLYWVCKSLCFGS